MHSNDDTNNKSGQLNPGVYELGASSHLSLFELLGYGYIFSAAGRLLGPEILGDFYQRNRDRSPRDVRTSAPRFFRPYQHLVLPIDSSAQELQGTITDGRVFACLREDGVPWALQVFVRTGTALWAVMIPAADEELPRFRNFLDTEEETPLVGRMWTLDADRGWVASPEVYRFAWPKQSVVDSEEEGTEEES